MKGIQLAMQSEPQAYRQCPCGSLLLCRAGSIVFFSSLLEKKEWSSVIIGAQWVCFQRSA